HIIPLDFEGWKYFTLCEPNNGDYPDIPLPGTIYKRWREIITYDKISRISILSYGDIKGVRLRDIKAMAVTIDAVKKPGIAIGGKELRFDCDLKPGTYVEYEAGGREATVYDLYGNGRPCGVSGETPELSAGKSNVLVLGEAEGYLRAAAHLIVKGEIV
ncbi:MAG: hypothetical protein LBC62_05650, partial [Treponema sp.]|nr:hypothetical protein [Treponema sp.]